MKTYVINRKGFTDGQWKKIVESDLTKFYNKSVVYDSDEVEITHENLYMTPEVYNLLRLDVLNTSNEFDESISQFIDRTYVPYEGMSVEIKGDNGGLGFIVDVFDSNNELAHSGCFHFSDYEQNDDITINQIKSTHIDDKGRVCIDVWFTDNADEEGITIATVDKDGNVIYDDNRMDIEVFQNTVKHYKVQEEVAKVVECVKEDKRQLLIDHLIESIKNDLMAGDSTVLAEILETKQYEYLKYCLPDDLMEKF